MDLPKAYRVETKADAGFSIYIAISAGKAKTCAVNSLRDSYREANYTWITSCRRAPEFDYLGNKNENSCVAWSSAEGERWQIDRGHWWHNGDVATMYLQRWRSAFVFLLTRRGSDPNFPLKTLFAITIVIETIAYNVNYIQ